jgi:predicted flap endonuclease-1-like 5' DNA nuclease
MRYHRTAFFRVLIASLGVASLSIASLSQAQSADVSERQMIQQLVQQVNALQERIQALESQRHATAAPNRDATSAPVTPPAAQTAPQPADKNAEPPSLPQDLHEVSGIQWRGFGEVDYKVLNQRIPELGTYGFVPGSSGDFYTGDFDLLLTARINDKASVLSEIVVGEGNAQSYSVDLARMLFNYDYNDHLRMSVGRYQTGIGHYNTAYHSSSWFQTTADRPLIMEFAVNGGVLPTQAVGLSFTGSIPSGGLGLNYIAEYGSSDMIRPDLDNTTITYENNSNNINVGLFAHPESIPGLQIGGSIYHDRISDFTRGPDVRLGQMIVNGHVIYIQHGIEFLSEGFLIRHAYEHSSLVYETPAFYSQISKQFHRTRPYVRYQYINANVGGLLDDLDLRYGPSFGVRYDFNDSIAFKTQFDHTVRKGEPELNGMHMQLVFKF